MKICFCNVTTVSDSELQDWFLMMSLDRQEKCRRIRIETAQRCCIAADHLARTMLAEHLKTSPEKIHIKVSPSGKPYIEGDPVCFSITHSNNLAVCALSETPVGIDLEFRRSVPETVQHRICNEEELQYLTCGQDERSERFFALWTRKEALFKLDDTRSAIPKHIPALHPEAWGATLQTSHMEHYTLSVAELKR